MGKKKSKREKKAWRNISTTDIDDFNEKTTRDAHSGGSLASAPSDSIFVLDKSSSSARMIMDPKTGRNKGFGFVTFETEAESHKAMKALNNRSKGGGIVCMLLGLFFLGTWPSVIASLERRGRLPQHTYLDYTITNLLAAIIIALTFGQIGESKPGMSNFFTQLSQVNWPSVLFAMAGGVVLSIWNSSTQYAWALVGLSVVEVVSSSITVVIGTTLKYFLDDRINNAEILLSGVGCFLIAVFLGSVVHKSNVNDNREKLRRLPTKLEEEAWNTHSLFDRNTDISASNKAHVQKVGSMGIEKEYGTKSEPKFGTANFLIQLEERRSIKVFGRSIYIGLAITFFAGCCFSLFFGMVGFFY